jgi:hypothetical protein
MNSCFDDIEVFVQSLQAGAKAQAQLFKMVRPADTTPDEYEVIVHLFSSKNRYRQ